MAERHDLGAMADDVAAVMAAAHSSSPHLVGHSLAGPFADYGDVPYLALFGIDPGPDSSDLVSGHISNSEVEVWDEVGHYPHLVDPDRLVEHVESFWSA